MSLNKRLDVTEEDGKKVLDLFQKFHPLNVWAKVKKDDFTMKRFELGYVNDILCCEMTEEARQRLCKKKDDCPAIVVKFSFDENIVPLDKLEEVIINTSLSAAGYGPRLLYIGEECMVHEFIENRPYTHEDDYDKENLRLLAKLMAGIHSMRPPISVKCVNVWNDGFGCLFTKDSRFPRRTTKDYEEFLDEMPEEFQKKYKFNLDEFDEIKKEQAKLNMPLVFGHSDFNRSNILINEILDTNGNKVKRLYAIDFDYSTYLPRGFDFGTYFCSFKHKDYLLGNDGFPSDEEIKFFVEEYRLESEQLQPGYLDDSINSTEQIVKEVKLSTLELYFARTYFSLGMSMQCKDNPEKRDTLMEGFKNRYTGYKDLKKILQSEGLISAN